MINLVITMDLVLAEVYLNYTISLYCTYFIFMLRMFTCE